MTSPTERRLEVLTLIQAVPGVTAASVAERIGVTERTARRHVARLREAGYRIDGGSGRYGGYRLAAGTAMPALMFDAEEILAVALGLRSISGVEGLGAAATTALTKLGGSVPARLQPRLAALSGLEAGSDGGVRTVDPEVFVALALACRAGEAVRLRRRSAAGQETPVDVQPFRLVRAGEVWYLVACRRGDGEWRVWAADRIKRVERLATVLPSPPPPPDAVAFVTERLALGRRHPVRVHVHTSAELVRERVPSRVAQVLESGDGAELRLATDDLDAVARWLLFLDLDFDVLEPPELADRLAALGRWLEARYGERAISRS